MKRDLDVVQGEMEVGCPVSANADKSRGKEGRDAIVLRPVHWGED